MLFINIKMKITIVTVAYNSAKTIKDTIESVLSQTYKNYEYIIVDGKSKDNTLDIVKEYEPRFEGRLRWISEPDKGIYDAMNKGISMATGDVVGILNSDDVYYDNSILDRVISAFIENGCDSVFGNLQFVKENDLTTIVRTWKGSVYTKNAFLKGWHPAHPTFYVKKEIYDKYGLFDISLAVSADFELMLRFIEKKEITTHYIDYNIVKMRMGGESTGSISRILKGNQNISKAFKKNNLKPYPFYFFRRLFPKVIEILKRKIN